MDSAVEHPGIYLLFKGVNMSDQTRISVDELHRRMDAGEDFVLIDTRNPQAWAQSNAKLPGALRIPAADPEQHLSELPKGKPIVTYCT